VIGLELNWIVLKSLYDFVLTVVEFELRASCLSALTFELCPQPPYFFHLCIFQIRSYDFAWGWLWTLILLPLYPKYLELQIWSIMPSHDILNVQT
jgi:hypothetical protein